ncbi:MAG: hypothetical protein ACRDTD_09685 [Pseudonocardiaceae bacterium]
MTDDPGEFLRQRAWPTRLGTLAGPPGALVLDARGTTPPDHLLQVWWGIGQWGAGYMDATNPVVHRQFVNTPEDTACKLAIELFKQGILSADQRTMST